MEQSLPNQLFFRTARSKKIFVEIVDESNCNDDDRQDLLAEVAIPVQVLCPVLVVFLSGSGRRGHAYLIAQSKMIHVRVSSQATLLLGSRAQDRPRTWSRYTHRLTCRVGDAFTNAVLSTRCFSAVGKTCLLEPLTGVNVKACCALPLPRKGKGKRR